MVSDKVIFGLGVAVSLVNILIWCIVIRSQLKQYKKKKNLSLKKALLVFSGAELYSNFVPIWFDLYQIIHHAHPSNIVYAYTTSQYVGRTIAAIMVYLVYSYEW